MQSALRQAAIVKPGGIVEVRSPDLAPGTRVEVIVIVEDSTPARSLRSIIGSGKGCFSTPQAADEFIHQERERWSF
ncbi:hypothetical protein H6G20_14415 [Desertifilum sp. FACHB-1129]|uniref:Uncharacterized protein n=2 Tax=Desertifilum tharense IPPAS B-1220 TaxID=1781255 RepID=A0A1E5QDM1_9CYAN|nr:MULTISPECIES: hypothetical protein [Desertifilum]MCD8488967.1 hypothetical protein [Desertifilum sp.]MDA0213663.1 hypothetical protein [Cyanobacteria bacterium FC1]MDI9634516.1 hypothetical protein [Geitlerinema splendidum]MDL5044820.1 hypothetical protein [Oscillatoria amoena NRMC-F 0135]NES98008.1 hypothetical protein [Desertifilum sp. SIO1I2]